MVKQGIDTFPLRCLFQSDKGTYKKLDYKPAVGNLLLEIN